MSERLPGGKNPEIGHFNSRPEKAPVWSYYDDPKCEARIAAKTIRQSVQRFITDFEGRRHDMGANIVDQLGEDVAEVTCESKYCPILEESFKAEGMGYAPYNQVNRDAREFLRENCGKWKARIKASTVSGKMPDNLLPR